MRTRSARVSSASRLGSGWLLLSSGALAFAGGCVPKGQPEPERTEPRAVASAPALARAPGATLAPGSARIGAPAPDFELADLDGKRVKLSSFRGKVVVLEWFNPHCPFVKASHTKGSLVDTALRQQRSGVVWLGINSAAPGRQGHGVEANREGQQSFKLTHPILLDEDGQVGHAYGAAHTPHMYVIDKGGSLVYRGAIDNSPDGEGESPEGGKLLNYVDAALTDLAAGRPVAIPETEAYGCSVKYQS
jgi:peroxiredoxin